MFMHLSLGNSSLQKWFCLLPHKINRLNYLPKRQRYTLALYTSACFMERSQLALTWLAKLVEESHMHLKIASRSLFLSDCT